MGAMALFGENYPDDVRVVEIGGPVLARTVRRHARAQLGADRPRDHPRRVLGRLGGAPRRGLRRTRLVQVPRQGTRADGRAGVVAEGAVGRGARPRRQPRRTAARSPRRNSTACGWPRRGRLQRTPPQARSWWVRSVSWHSAWPAGSRRQTCAVLVGDIRGKLGSEPAVVALIAEGEGDSVPYVVAVNAGRAGSRPERQRPGQGARCGGERTRRRQGRTCAGLRQRRLGHRRGAGRVACRGRPELAGWPDSGDRQPDRPGLGDPPDPGRGRRLGVDVGHRAHRRRHLRPRRDPRDARSRPCGATAPTGTFGRLATAGRRTRCRRGGRRTAPHPGRPDRTVGARCDRGRRRPGRAHRPDPGTTGRRAADDRDAPSDRCARPGVRAKGQKAMIDQAAAVGILQTWLDQRRARHGRTRRSGRCLSEWDAASARSRWRSGGRDAG